MKQRAMFFTKTNARVLKNSDIDKKIKNLVINPDLTLVSGVEPQYWIFKEGKIVAMNAGEKAERDMQIIDNGIINDPEYTEDEIEYESDDIAKEVVKIQNSKPISGKLLIAVGLLAFIIGFILRGII